MRVTGVDGWLRPVNELAAHIGKRMGEQNLRIAALEKRIAALETAQALPRPAGDTPIV